MTSYPTRTELPTPHASNDVLLSFGVRNAIKREKERKINKTYLLCDEHQTYRLATYTIESARHATIAEMQLCVIVSALRSAAASITP